MLKKTIAIVGFAGALVVLGAGGAQAITYPPAISCTASPPTLDAGQTSTITCGGDGAIEPGTSVVFTVSGEGVSGSSLAAVFAAVGSAQVTKTASADGTASTTFTAPQVSSTSTYTISASDAAGTFAATVGVTVNGSGGSGTGAGGTDGQLSSTGQELPTALIWAGVGALGFGAIAVTAAMARRRARSQ